MTIKTMDDRQKKSRFILAFMMLCYCLPIAYVFAAKNMGINAENNSFIIFTLLFQPFYLFAIPTVILSKAFNINLKQTLPLKELRGSEILVVILLTVLFLPLMSVVASVLSRYVNTSSSAAVSAYIQAFPLPLSLLVFALLPAISEELVFRGVFLPILREYSEIEAIVISAVFFGLAHNNAYQYGYGFFAGLFLAYLVCSTGSLYASVISHFTINALQVVLAYIFKNTSQIANITEEAAKQTTFKQNSILIVIFFGLFCITAEQFSKRHKIEGKKFVGDSLQDKNIITAVLLSAVAVLWASIKARGM